MDNEQKITGNITPAKKDLEVLKKHFPQCFDKNGNFDFEKFKKELSDKEINFSKESYGLDWLGKSYARLLATDETPTLLQENEEFNAKPENKNSENLLIKGDNLEVLKHLTNAYNEKIKMIYIDPPYNTGSDGFVYQDNRKFTVDELQELAGISEEKAKRILEFTQSKSNSHSAWLTFMYPRLYIARQLLKDDGVIFVSIDDNEIAQLRIMMDEIFGEENFVGMLSVENNPKGRKNSDYISISNDYLLIYAKQIDKGYFIENIPKNIKDLKLDKETGKYIHGSGKRVLVGENSFNKKVSDFNSDKHYSVYYNQSNNDLKILKEKNINDFNLELINKGYIRYASIRNQSFIENTYTSDKLNKLFQQKALEFKNNKIFEKNFNTSIRIKSMLVNQKYKAYINGSIKDFVLDLKTTSAGKALKDLFGTKDVIFPMPKNIGLIKILLSLFDNKNFIALDFFAGSGTTGHAVMQLNAEDGGNRKYILVQLPEKIDPKKNKTAYDFVKNELGVEEPAIFDITKERLIRASKKIQEDNQDKDLSQMDFGFKIFETIPVWEDYNFEADELNEQTSLFDETKLSEDDIKALLVTWKTFDGIPLTEDLQKVDLNGYTSYYAGGKLYLMNKGFTTDNLKNLLEKIDKDENFNPVTIIAFGYYFKSKNLREIFENTEIYKNKKNSNIKFIIRY